MSKVVKNKVKSCKFFLKRQEKVIIKFSKSLGKSHKFFFKKAGKSCHSTCHDCLHLLASACICLHLLASACISLHLLAFASLCQPVLACASLCQPLLLVLVSLCRHLEEFTGNAFVCGNLLAFMGLHVFSQAFANACGHFQASQMLNAL